METTEQDVCRVLNDTMTHALSTESMMERIARELRHNERKYLTPHENKVIKLKDRATEIANLTEQLYEDMGCDGTDIDREVV